MRKEAALKLHKGDKVHINSTGEEAEVLQTYLEYPRCSSVTIECIGTKSGHRSLNNTQIS